MNALTNISAQAASDRLDFMSCSPAAGDVRHAPLYTDGWIGGGTGLMSPNAKRMSPFARRTPEVVH
jgi:hypothetical protein